MSNRHLLAMLTARLLVTGIVFASMINVTSSARAQATEHEHNHGGPKAAVEPPKVFLDKARPIVEFQLKRLSNEQLLLVTRATDDAKYAPVFQAILVRSGMTRPQREEALAGLAAVEKSNPVAALLASLDKVKDGDETTAGVGLELAAILLAQQPEALAAEREALERVAQEGATSASRQAALAALLATQPADAVWAFAEKGDAISADLLASIPLVPNAGERAGWLNRVLPYLGPEKPLEVRLAAASSLASIPSSKFESFRNLVPLFATDELRPTVVRALLAIRRAEWDASQSSGLVQAILDHAAKVPTGERTSDVFLDEMELADALLALLPADQARPLRERLGEFAVRVVRINTVLEEMRYDKTVVALEAGKPVQIVLKNNDAMPHNLVVVAPGALREVGTLSSAMQPTNDGNPRQFIPTTDKLLVPADLCPPGQQILVTFTAPTEPGEYPFVCTFPNHWFRMYGVFVVVADLAAWEANPTTPADPLGQTRAIVRNWTPEDFDLATDLAALGKRDFTIGQNIFNEAGCAKCHKIAGQGGVVGPDLTEVIKRHEGKRDSVLTEMLDPSKKIVEQFAQFTVVTIAGDTVTGLVKSQDDKSVALMTNPESTATVTILRGDIEEMICSKTSMMPKALLDRFTKEEILQLLSFLEAGGSAEHAVYSETTSAVDRSPAPGLTAPPIVAPAELPAESPQTAALSGPTYTILASIVPAIVLVAFFIGLGSRGK